PKRLLTWRRGLIAALLIVGIAFGVLRLAPTDDFVFIPGKTRLVAPLVKVPDEQDPPAEGGIYMVDIRVKSATLFDRAFPGLNGDATVVDGDVLNPQGVSDEQREQRSTLQMVTSQDVSAAVALEALGYDVEADPAGVLVDLVQPEGAATGILEPGDIITSAEGLDVATPSDLAAALEPVEPGATITLQVERDDGLEEVMIETFADPDDPERALIGIRIEQAATIDLPIDIEIDTGNVGGPSAGLAFALDIVDELGPRDLDAGRTIVVTGTLELDGSVGAIGGVKQKAVSARELGADLFLVPVANEEVARDNAGDVEVFGVETLDEALEAITGEPVSALALGELQE
ncbi:MAG: YlbL family protein, partial [Gaiellaceae bacterium]